MDGMILASAAYTFCPAGEASHFLNWIPSGLASHFFNSAFFSAAVSGFCFEIIGASDFILFLATD
jgi:hypothetical protein